MMFWKRPWWDPFWYAVDTPEVGDTAYKRGLLFVGHFGLAMMACAPLLLIWWATTLPLIYSALLFAVIPMTYHKLKEGGDKDRGGSERDGNEDTYGVATGCWAFAAFVIANILVAAGVIVIGAAYIIYAIDRHLKREFNNA